ncbi:hypothetical protein SK128_025843, partial [Halocaridina rubra]
RSTILQMLWVMGEWARTIDEGGVVDVIYMDFQNAFDKPDKCKHLKISKSRRAPEDTEYYSDKQSTERVKVMKATFEKNLGIITDSHLTFKANAHKIMNKINQIMVMI